VGPYTRTGRRSPDRLGARSASCIRPRHCRWFGLAEDGVNDRLRPGEPPDVFLGGRVVSAFATELDLQGQQLVEVLLVGRRPEFPDVVGDGGRLAGPPGRLEGLAAPMDGTGPGQRVAGIRSGAVVAHQASSTNDIQVLRIRSSRRAMVRRAQPSWPAISSFV